MKTSRRKSSSAFFSFVCKGLEQTETTVVTQKVEKSTAWLFFSPRLDLSRLAESSMKNFDPPTFLPSIPSEDHDESEETKHRRLAPLASSETFTDVHAITNESNLLPSPPLTGNSATKGDYDSLEALFDFPSSGISSDVHLEELHASQSSGRIRFADNDQIITTSKVKLRRRGETIDALLSRCRRNEKS